MLNRVLKDEWKKLVIIKIILMKVLYLYIFDDFCQKKMLGIDLQTWIYFLQDTLYVYVSLNNQQCMQWMTLPSQGLPYYPYAVNLDRCLGSCNCLDDLSNRVRVPNKTLNSTCFYRNK